MIKLMVDKTSAIYTDGREELTAGRVGLLVEVIFSADWDGLAKIAVVSGSGAKLDAVVGADGTFTIPCECMETPGGQLKIGIYGTSGDGTVVIPTVYCVLGIIREGVVPAGESGSGTSPTIYDQFLAEVQDLVSSADNARAAAENAAERAKTAGMFVSCCIGDDGRLYYVQSDNAEDIEMKINDNGRLVITIE